MRFDKVVSLGKDCKAAFQLDRLGLRESCVFDWLITPWEALTAYIESDFAGFLELGRLRVRGEGDGVVDAVTDLQILHDFKTDEQHRTNAALIEEDLPRVREKFDHLIAKWRSLGSARRLLFVRSKNGEGEDAAELLALLRRRFPDSGVQLLLVANSFPHPEVKGATLKQVVNDAGPDPDFWKGSDPLWDEIMAGIGVETRPLERVWTAYD